MLNSMMNLEDKLTNHVQIQYDAKMKSDIFGVEIELEGKGVENPTDAIYDYWTAHNDNSLRKLKPGDGAIEYVFSKPYDLKTTEVAVSRMMAFLNGPKITVYDSYRTSIHVHLNFGIEPFRVIYNFMALSLILDELLVSQNGEHRIGNNFCLRAKDALGQVTELTQSIEGGHAFFSLQPNNRYSSINFASLLKFGSIEFRSLECTTHEGRVMHWIKTLNRIKEISRTYRNPAEVIQQFSMFGPREFLSHVLGPYAIKYANVPGVESMLRNGMRIAQDFAYCSAWKERS